MNSSPLADILRPQKFSEFFGQKHLVGKDGIISRLLSTQSIPSMILWGPPGSGKTTLAHLISQKLDAEFIALSATSAKIDEVKKIITEAWERKQVYGKRTILFIDEIHRFNKAQQDAFLPSVEKGTIILIGATTENPSFEVISPLLSRSRVLVLSRLSESELKKIADLALTKLNKSISREASAFLLESANGDARSLLNTIEIAAQISQGKIMEMSDIESALQKKQLQYDRLGDEHYNTISAFIKSMRASQIDAAIYYLARMITAGEDPLFIARRMVVFASEDVAAPTAIVVANAVFQACQQIGYPECQENLAAGVVYLTQAKKDRSAYDAFMNALADVKRFGNLPIPLKVRNAPTKLMKDLHYGESYQSYDTESYLPEKLKRKKYYIRK